MSNNVRWEPVEGGHVVNNPARMCKLVVDNDDDAILWFLCDGLTLGGVRLRPDERLCRAKSAPPVATPEPDWSQAPEWAMWTAINPAGRRIWCENKPRFFAYVDGMAYWRTEDGRERGEQIGLPYGVDTRTTLRRRPEVSGE